MLILLKNLNLSFSKREKKKHVSVFSQDATFKCGTVRNYLICLFVHKEMLKGKTRQLRH